VSTEATDKYKDWDKNVFLSNLALFFPVSVLDRFAPYLCHVPQGLCFFPGGKPFSTDVFISQFDKKARKMWYRFAFGLDER
jgi:hypothetical protein